MRWNANYKKMRKLLLISMLLSLIFASACINEIKDMKSTDAKYPVADRQPEKLEKHGFNIKLQTDISGIRMELPLLLAWK